MTILTITKTHHNTLIFLPEYSKADATIVDSLDTRESISPIRQTQETSTILGTTKPTFPRTRSNKPTELNMEDQSINMDQEFKDTATGAKNGDTQLNGVIQDAED